MSRRSKEFLRLLGKYLKLSKELCLIGEPTEEYMDLQDEELAIKAELLEFISENELAIIQTEQMLADKKFMRAMGYKLVGGKWVPAA